MTVSNKLFYTAMQERLLMAKEALSNHEWDSDKCIHECRKAIKRTRSMNRLLRKELPDYDHNNGYLRETSHLLGPFREGRARLDLIKSLAKKKLIPDDLKNQVESELAQKVNSPEYEEQKRAVITQCKKRLDSFGIDPEWKPAKSNLIVTIKGLKPYYKKGKKEFKKCLKNPEMENLHQWRKRVKDLYYQVEWINALSSEKHKQSSLENQLDSLSDDLGLIHDVDEFLSDYQCYSRKTKWQINWQKSLINYRNDEMKKARKKGKKIYSPSPSQFIVKKIEWLENGVE